MTLAYPVRVLVVDDSAYLRKVLSEMLLRSPRIEVVGSARNGLDALEKVAELRPDVVTLDLFMPEMDGLAFLRQQMARRPIPTVVCSIASQDGQAVLAAMEAGAVEFIHKPTALSLDQVYSMGDELIQKVLTAASVPADKLVQSPQPSPETIPTPVGTHRVDAVMIGVSTGGPQALRQILPRFPANFPVPLAIVLHMPVGYTGPLAEKMNEQCALEILEAAEGLEMRPGRAILARAGYHLCLRQDGSRVLAHLDLTPTDTPHRPAVDVLFRTAADVYGSRTLGVVLTGMGNDGAVGSAWIKSQGGLIFTEDESTCVIYGMPRSVVEAGLSDRSIPLYQMVTAIQEMV